MKKISSKILQEDKYDLLSPLNIAGYSVGHVFNDITGSLWFFQTLIYLNKVQSMTSEHSGLVLFLGQLSDAISTPVMGIISDKLHTSIGKRIPVQIFGLIIQLIFFLAIFEIPVNYTELIYHQLPDSDLDSIKLQFQVSMGILQTIGWGSIQIGHMSLIPQITLVEETRCKLVGYRQSFTYISTLIVLILAFILFPNIDDNKTVFFILVSVSVGIGLLCSLFFLLTVDEVTLTNQTNIHKDKYKAFLRKASVASEISASKSYLSNSQIANDMNNCERRVAWWAWFKFPIFYSHVILYTASKVVMNVSMCLTPQYLNDVLKFSDSNESQSHINSYIATIPIVTQVFSMLTGASQFKLVDMIPEQILLTINSIIGVILFGVLYFIGNQIELRNLVYIFQALIGVITAIMITGATTKINNVIGEQSSSGAFVIGFQSFVEKASTGYLISILFKQMDHSSASYVNYVNSIVPITALVVFVLILWTKFRFPKFLRGDIERVDNQSEANLIQANSKSFIKVEGQTHIK